MLTDLFTCCLFAAFVAVGHSQQTCNAMFCDGVTTVCVNVGNATQPNLTCNCNTAMGFGPLPVMVNPTTKLATCTQPCNTEVCDGVTSFCMPPNNGGGPINQTGSMCQCVFGYTNLMQGANNVYSCTPMMSAAPPMTSAAPPKMDATTAANMTNVQYFFIAFYIACLLGAMIAHFVLCSFASTERIIHFNQELMLIITFILMLFTANTDNQSSCTAIGIMIQYTFLVALTFFCLEALHTFSFVTAVIPRNSYLPVFVYIILGYVIPLVMTGIVVGIYYSWYSGTQPLYVKPNCWSDATTPLVATYTGPVALGIFAVLILLESQRIGTYQPLKDVDNVQMSAARSSSFTLWIVALLTVATYLVGMMAVDQQYLAWWIVFDIFIAVSGPCTLLAHCAANPKMRCFLGRYLPFLRVDGDSDGLNSSQVFPARVTRQSTLDNIRANYPTMDTRKASYYAEQAQGGNSRVRF